MSGTRNAKGTGQKSGQKADESSVNDVATPTQIEYLLQQSTQGVHLMFENADIAKIMRGTGEKSEFFSTENMEQVQSLLSAFLNCPTLEEKKIYLKRLPKADYELLVRAYFQLVDNTILAHSTQKH